MKSCLLLLTLLALPRNILAQTDSCAIYNDQFNTCYKAKDLRNAVQALIKNAECHQHRVQTEIEEDSILLFRAVAGSLYDRVNEPDLAWQQRKIVIDYYEANPNPKFLQHYLMSMAEQIQQYFLAFKRPECLEMAKRLYNIPPAQLIGANASGIFFYTGGFQQACLLLRREGRLQDAEQYARRLISSLQLLNISEDQSEFRKARIQVAEAKYEMGLFDEAEPIFQQLYDQLLTRKGISELDRATESALLMARLSQLKGRRGQNEQRELLIRQLLKQLDTVYAVYNAPDSAAARKSGSYNTFKLKLGAATGELASIIEDRGMPEEAFPVYLKSLAAIEATSMGLTYGKRTPDYEIIIGNIGYNYSKLGKYNEAGQYLRRSIVLADSIFGKGSFSFAQAKLQAYASEWGRRQGQEAITQCREALQLPVAAKNEAYPLMLSNYSLVLLANGQYQQADSVLSVAWAIAKTRHPFSSEITQLITSKKLLAAINRQQYHSADSLFGKLLTLNRTLLLNRFLGLTEGEKQRLLEKNSYRNLFATYALQRLKANPALADTLYNQQLDYKGILLWSSRKIQNAMRQSSDSSLRATFGVYQRIRQQLAVVSSLTEQQRRGLRVDSLERTANQLEKELVTQLPGFANQRARYTWQQVQAKLKPGQAALEIVRFQHFQVDSAGRTTDTIRYAALLLKPGFTHPKIILLPNGNQLETTWLGEWQQHILKKQPDQLSYGRYWQAIARELTGVKRLYFSPDGIYHQLNPASLFNPVSRRYVLDELEVTLLTTTRDLAQPVASPGLSSQALLMGFPSYSLSLGKRDSLQPAPTHTLVTRSELPEYSQPALTRGEIWQPLPGTKREVEQIGALLRQKQYKVLTLTGDQAREGILKTQQNPTILHLATHAFFKSDTSRRVLGSQNPMLRAGLVLAGAQQRDTTLANLLNPTTTTDDGILTALEAADLPLDSTQLVVLSACQTGVGVVRTGEGVYGLQRAFRMAGAKAILMSLWKVNDTATQRLMTLFYQHWLNGQSKAEALRQAQQQLRQQRGYESPYYWAAFVLVGQ